MPAPLLDPAGLEALRAALAPFTTDGVDEALGPVGRAALARADLAGAARALRGVDAPAAALTRLFTLGEPLPEAAARAALGAAFDPALAAGLVAASAGEARALLDVRPYAEAGGPPWWVVCDLGAEVRAPAALAADHVLGVGAASTTLAQATARSPAARALDLGTGSGVQALHLSRHAASVTGTDISERALRMAATTAALAGLEWDLRAGSFTEPVAGERFDLVVTNPPFVVSPGDGGYDYRDSGLAGDEVSRMLVTRLPGLLAPGGTAQLLANWIVPARGSWQERVGSWLEGAGCDAWVWQREVADLGEYAALWLRDAGLHPGTAAWRRSYDHWLDWFAAHDVAAVGMGLITLWHPGREGVRGRSEPDIVLEDVPQALAAATGAEIAAFRRRRDWLLSVSDRTLLDAALVPAADIVRTRADLLDARDGGWRTRRETLRQSHGLRWEVELDDAVASVVAACGEGASARLALEVLCAARELEPQSVADALVPVLRDLVSRGFLEPQGARR